MHIHKRRIHLIGIGGAGMSALAEIMQSSGHYVTGSDCRKTRITERLETLGIGVQYSHTPRLITDADLVVYSSAVNEDNEERRYAHHNRIETMRRAEMMGQLMRAKFSIGISGTHGKTTTTSLIGHVLAVAGYDPTIVVGGTMRGRGSNAVVGNGTILVAEADEYDRSFLAMSPSVAVITNIEADHLDCYRDVDDIKQAFTDYARSVPFYGVVVACADDANVREIAGRAGKALITYATEHDADYRASDIAIEQGKTVFRIKRGQETLGSAKVGLMGMHNVRNCLAAAGVCCEMGVSFKILCEALSSFSGIRRRFEQVGFERGVAVIDDYAHHPSEIAATLSAARDAGYKRVTAVFQPHLYTRTRDFLDAFAASLSAADAAIVTQIYKAREEKIEGVGAEQIVQRMQKAGHADACYIETMEDIAAAAARTAREGDCILLMGAGDINEIAPAVCERLRNG
jgi:UDP-N-acetylmuramate--alanine ligase